MSRIKDITGQKFNRLTIIEFSHIHNKSAYWKCLCDCGNTITCDGKNIRNNHTQSCGCLQKQRASEASKTHGMEGTPVYRIWRNMINRCYNENVGSFQHYGKRGIKVCDKWRYSFEAFFKDMGQPPTQKYTIDRINYNGNYEKRNCRWATRKEQARNTRTNRQITHNGKTKLLCEWAEETGIKADTIGMRLKRGWSIQKALTTKV